MASSNIIPGAVTLDPVTGQFSLSPSDGSPSQQIIPYNGDTSGSAPVTQAPTSSAQTLQPAVDPSIGQYYDQLTANTNAQINRLPGQLQVGQANINNAYQTGANHLTTAKNQATRNYNTASDQALQQEVANEGDINFQTGQQTNALQRLLGAAGFGSSAAALQAVPYATGLVGAGQLRNSQQAFGRNQQALDTNYNDYLQGWDQSFNQLGQQRDQQNNALQASIDQNKASLLQQLANIAQQRASVAPGASYADIVKAAQPYQDQINSLGGQIDQLGAQYANPVFAANSPAYQPPALETYVPQATAAQIGGAPGAASNLGYFTNLLLNGGQQQQANLAGQPVVG